MSGESVEESTEESPKATKFCQECGSEINKKAEICPDCGVRQAGMEEEDDREARASQFIYAGLALGALSLLFLPILFGPLAVFCGILAMIYGRPMAGAGVVVWGVLAAVIGYILGILVWAAIL